MGHHANYDEHKKELAAIRKHFEKDSKRLGLGATGAYPEGVVNDMDEGEIQFGIAHDPKNQKVFVNFGKSVDMVGMTLEQAVEFADLLQKHVRECRGITV